MQTLYRVHPLQYLFVKVSLISGCSRLPDSISLLSGLSTKSFLFLILITFTQGEVSLYRLQIIPTLQGLKR